MPDAGQTESLRHEVHVWLARPQSWPLQELTAQYAPLLSEEERQRCQRFHFAHDRQHYLIAHAMLRLALARYLGSASPQVRLTTSRNGKPELAAESGNGLPLRFNLSHTQGMVACALTLARDCGIDVEGIRPMRQMDGVAETVFSAAENAYLAACSEAGRLSAFFTQWTLKEAYIKATGLGMSAALRQISIDPRELSVRDDSSAAHSRQDWLFDAWQPGPEHALALACNGAATLDAIVYHEFDLAGGALHVLRRRQIGPSAP